MAVLPLGARIEQTLRLDAIAIKTGTQTVGNLNPPHHAEAAAATRRFGELNS